jgi:hypothetical protein
MDRLSIGRARIKLGAVTTGTLARRKLPALTDFAHAPARTLHERPGGSPMGQGMKVQQEIRQRLEILRGQFLSWGTPEAQVFVTTKDELRGWIRSLEWVLGHS